MNQSDLDGMQRLQNLLHGERHKHIEEFAAAYFQQTNIPPDEAELCVQPSNTDFGFRYWFTQHEHVLIKRQYEQEIESLSARLSALVAAAEAAVNARQGCTVYRGNNCTCERCTGRRNLIAAIAAAKDDLP